MIVSKQMLIASALTLLASLYTANSLLKRTIPTGGELSLEKSDKESELLTLVKKSSNGKTLVPVGRSYNKGDWENVAGPYARLKFECLNGVTFCKVNLTDLEAGEEYQVRSMTHSLEKKDEFARLLEQATFGTTRESLEEIMNISDTVGTVDETITTWTYNQMYKVPMSSHRAWYRKRVLHRWESNHIARSMHACEKLTRYRRASISSRDWKKYVVVKQEFNRVSLYVGGYIRTVVNSLNWANANDRTRLGDLKTNNQAYYLCATPGEGINQTLSFQDPVTKGCLAIGWDGIYGLPPVQFFNNEVKPGKVIVLKEEHLDVINENYFPEGSDQEIIITRDIDDKLCPDIAAENDEVPVFGKRALTNEYYIHDPPPKLLPNSMRNPAMDGGTSSVKYTDGITNCANVDRNFINEKFCKLSTDISTCGKTASSALDITLTEQTFRTFYNVTSKMKTGARYVYAIDKLRISAESNTVSPCTKGSKSRWIPSPENDSSCTNTLQEATKTRLKGLMTSSKDTNPYMRDILNEVGGCAASDIDVKDFLLDVNGKCWKHVHQDHLQVFDFTYWTRGDTHPGNTKSRNPIKEFAEADSFYLDFPGWHGMDRWVTNRGYFTEVGRYGDKVAYSELPPLLVSGEIAKAFGGESFDLNGAGVLVCGSPFEIGNDPRLEGTEGRGAFDMINYMNRTTNGGNLYRQKHTIWTHLALYAPDQLRQRAAWALYQIVTLAQPFVQSSMDTEQHTMYWDIFIRHAFGNFKDLLKEVAYTPIMGENLSFLNGRSTYFQWDKFKNVGYPDENFAREVMQLFTVGLCKLFMDGSEYKNKDGSCVQMYNNDVIMEYARAWTGFGRRQERGGVETGYWANFHDPMWHNPWWRDAYPKMGLDGQYIGDKLPLCADRPKKRPKQHFLKKGAKYILLGASSLATKHTDPVKWAFDPDATKMVLTAPSQEWSNVTKYLYTYLCRPDGEGNCRPKAVVNIPKNLRCAGMECKVDNVRVVQVLPDLYYEYVAEPCAYQAYIKGAVKTNNAWSKSNLFCADPRVDTIASPACCTTNSDTSSPAFINELYYGERTTLETAIERCNEIGKPVCDYPTVRHNSCMDGGSQCDHGGQYWSKAPCMMFVKVNPTNGKIAIVHGDKSDYTATANEVNKDTFVYFRVHWKKNKFPVPDTCSSNPFCEVYNGMCICEVEVIEYPAYKTMPTREEAINRLQIGAFNPKFYKYEICMEQDGVILHCNKNWKNKMFKKNAIFEVIDKFGRKVYLKNMRSTVKVKGDEDFHFRNPPHINKLIIGIMDEKESADETDATIDHYVYNENTPPNVAKKLIQRFGVSNPSPSFIFDVATAFKTGSYTWNGQTFGKGEYGDLAATFAAILLHRETRSVVLDKDGSHGGFREPLLRVMSFMRAMVIVTDKDKPLIEFNSMDDKIGQFAYQMKSVFGFYLPDYTPPGRIALSSLVSPEAQLNTGPYILGLINGLFSTVKYGLNNWWDGFFNSRGGNPRRDPGFYGFSIGQLGYEPTGTTGTEVVEELSTLLTSGRLSEESKKIIANVYDGESNKLAAKMMAQQLIVTSPEFNTIGLVERSGEARPAFVKPTPSAKEYKAVVFLYLDGGIDSFNVIVPKCEPLRSQYNAKRLAFALPNGQLLPVTIAADSPPQPCNDFGIHYLLPDLQRSFNAQETLFFANAGVLNAPVNRKNYEAVTATPLFAHNTMKAEAQRLDPYAKVAATGVLGRMMDELYKLDYTVNAIAVEDAPVVLKGRVGESPPMVTVKREGSLVFDPYPWSMRPAWSQVDLFSHIQKLNNVTTIDSSMYGETWASDFLRVIDENALLEKAISTATLSTNFGIDDYGYSKKLAQVARLIKTKDIRGVDRDAFFVEFIKWDTHLEQIEEIAPVLQNLNKALDSFWKEMKVQGNFDKVVMVSISDFARTLSPNSSDGTDHAWGGHYFMTGGKVRGKRIMGEYPADLDGPLNVDNAQDGRGRFIPTTAYEGIWNGVSEWMGVEDEDALDRIMPNRQTCGSSYMFSKEDLFKP